LRDDRGGKKKVPKEKASVEPLPGKRKEFGRRKKKGGKSGKFRTIHYERMIEMRTSRRGEFTVRSGK